VNFSEAINSGYANYFRLQGRARRAEYWWFVLFGFLLDLVVMVFQVFERLSAPPLHLIFGLFALVFGLAQLSTIIPSVTLEVRRLHDTGRSGKWVAWQIAALIFAVFLLTAGAAARSTPVVLFGTALGAVSFALSLAIFVFLLLPGDRNDNPYGTPRT